MKMFKTVNYLLLSMVILACMACDALEEELGDVLDDVAVCPEVCLNIEECGANPPPPANVGSLGDSVLPENGIAACATNCVQTSTRHRLGYSDCQIECLQTTSCGKLEDCWDTRSDTYQKFCLKDVTVPEIKPEPAPAPEPEPGEPEPEPEPEMSIDNGTVTGN